MWVSCSGKTTLLFIYFILGLRQIFQDCRTANKHEERTSRLSPTASINNGWQAHCLCLSALLRMSTCGCVSHLLSDATTQLHRVAALGVKKTEETLMMCDTQCVKFCASGPTECEWLVPCWRLIYCLFSSKGFDRGLLLTVDSIFMADQL